MARDRVVAVVIERLLDAFGNHDRPGEMHDRADLLLGEYALDQLTVSDIAFVETDVVWKHVACAGRKVVDDRDSPTRVPQRENGVAADIAGPAGHEHRKLGHARRSLAEAWARR